LLNHPSCRFLLFFARDAGDLVIFSNHKTARALTRHDARPGRSLPAAVTRMWRPSTLDSLKRTDGILRQAPKMGEMHVIPQAISRQSCALFPSISASSRRQPPTDPGKKMTNETSVTDASETTLRGGRSGPRQKRRQTGHKESGGGCGVGTPPPIGGVPGARAGLSSPGWMTLLVAKPTQSLVRVYFACKNTF
jgi:hypothetical protein